MARAQIGNELSDLRVGEGIAEGGHLLPAIHDLAGDFGRCPLLVLIDVEQRRGLFAADGSLAMAVGATLVAKERGAGQNGGVIGGEEGQSAEKDNGGEKGDLRVSHVGDFLTREAGAASTAGRRCGSRWRSMQTGLSNAALLRQELMARNRLWARGRAHVESYGEQPVIVYAPEDERHGNFFDGAYEAMLKRPEWMRRFGKIHAQGRSLPKAETGRRWRELDSSMSSDALLMNIFCAPGVLERAEVWGLLGLGGKEPAAFGWKARVPLKNGGADRTEVDLRLGTLLVESKLTEGDFQICERSVAEGYRDFEEVFDAERLPRVEIAVGRRREATEQPEDYSQEFESVIEAAAFEPGWRAEVAPPRPSGVVEGYASYQLIRNVLAAYAEGCRFCVLHDERRPELREAWFEVMSAVRMAELRVRLGVLTWQELAASLPEELQEFLAVKYGIVTPGGAADWPEI